MLFTTINTINETLIGTNGFVSIGQTQRILDSAIDAIVSAKQRIGDLDNLSGTNASFINSIVSSIGRMDKLNRFGANDYRVEDYEETIIISADNEAHLSLSPESIISFEILTDSHLWTPKPSGVMSDPGDFWINGNKVYFFSSLGHASVVVRYIGLGGSSISTISGNRQNVIPSPSVLTFGTPPDGLDPENFAPLITRISASRYRLDLSKFSTSDGLSFDPGHPIPFTISPEIAAHINPGATTRVPSNLISIHRMISGNQFRRIDTYGIYLVSNYVVEFETTDIINETQDILVVSMSNLSIADAIEDIYEILEEHSHDGTRRESSLVHNVLSGVVPVSRIAGVNYSFSSSVEYAHPQYLSRDGYDPAALSSYRNIMLGDLVVGSTDSGNRFDNIVADSNSIIFGSHS